MGLLIVTSWCLRYAIPIVLIHEKRDMEGGWHLPLVVLADRTSYNIQGSDYLLSQACFKVTAGSALYQLCAGPCLS